VRASRAKGVNDLDKNHPTTIAPCSVPALISDAPRARFCPSHFRRRWPPVKEQRARSVVLELEFSGPVIFQSPPVRGKSWHFERTGSFVSIYRSLEPHYSSAHECKTKPVERLRSHLKGHSCEATAPCIFLRNPAPSSRGSLLSPAAWEGIGLLRPQAETGIPRKTRPSCGRRPWKKARRTRSPGRL
jgi:hypothetical protein